jgi:hypothetical protein
MTSPTRLWIACAYRPALRTGGWAHIRVAGDKTTGAAGGDRRIGARRVALSGLVAALRPSPDASSLNAQGPEDILLHTTDVEVAALAEHLTKLVAGSVEVPGEDLDLWAQLQTALTGRRLKVVRLRPEPQTPQAFAAAWADLGLDKAKAGAFTAAIPKTNLAKVAGL